MDEEKGLDVLSASKPPREAITGYKATVFRASIIASSEVVEEGVGDEGIAFKRTEPGKMTGSCGMIFRCERRVERGIVLVERESIMISPESRSRRRKSARRSEDLPLPVRPQMAIFWPAWMEKEMLRRTGSDSALLILVVFRGSFDGDTIARYGLLSTGEVGL